ncbi:hypothetical protein JVU11DRAFT_1638 [Chiua virens]|nr:hypothetical protein JVU11DRAFT_1638 [Chiua virens]
MKYVALLSGGKDSCFNLLHCQHNHHQLVAAATLSPHSGKDEIDSYMYQTVGQDAIALVAQALDVPLYRRVIQGNPLQQAAEYGLKTAGGGGIPGDETEDLYALLFEVLHHHPDIQAVSVGAILSNYQRVRVEHVCRRLSLTPLAYLWQRNQTSLLSEMIASGLDAILIKIAGAGLTPSDLARSLSSMQPKLMSLHQKFGTHPCGEGGEYETFTIDSPLFKSWIDIKEKEIVVADQSDVAPETTSMIRLDIPAPLLLEHPFATLLTFIEDSLHCAPPDPLAASGTNSFHPELGPSVRRIGPWIAVGNVRLPKSDPQPLNVGEEVTRCFEILQNLLAKSSPAHGNLLPTSATITLLLPDLDGSTFSMANTAYASFFGTSPPARACVGVGGVGVGLDCLAWAEEWGRIPDNKMASKKMTGEMGTRKALHCSEFKLLGTCKHRSLFASYQCLLTCSFNAQIPPYTFISGQIGLIPSSLTLPPPSSESSTLPLETALVLQHTARIIRAAPNSGLGDGSEGGFGVNDSRSEVDSGDVSRNANGEGGWIQLAIYYLVHRADVDHVRKHVESVDGLTPTVYVVLLSLPRGARVEKQVLVHSGRFVVSDPDSSKEEEDEEELVVAKSPQFVQGDLLVQHPECTMVQNFRSIMKYPGFLHSSETCAIMFVRHSDVPHLPDTLAVQAVIQMRAIQEFTPFIERTLVAKAFVSHSNGSGRLVVSLLKALFKDEMPAVTVIPSQYVESRVGDGWDWAVTLMAV